MLRESEYPATLSRVELEMQVAWIVSSPAIFKEQYDRFFSEHRNFKISCEAAAGTITLVAERIFIDEQQGE